MRKINYALLLFIILTLSACQKDFRNAIPADSSALMRIDLKELDKQENNANHRDLAQLLGIANEKDCGLSINTGIYLFETADGNLGLAAEVANKKRVKNWLNELAQKGKCEKVSEYRSCNFTIVDKSWCIGFSDDALLLMGPILAAEQTKSKQRIAHFLKQKEGIVGSALFDKLDSIKSPIGLVAQAQALPTHLSVPFMIVAPRDTDPTQVIIAAPIEVEENVLTLNAEVFSFDKATNNQIKQNLQKFKTLKETFMNGISDQTLLTMITSVNGVDFLQMLHNSKDIAMLLNGINTAVDMDNILRSVNGDLMIAFADNNHIDMHAQIASTKFLDDIDYWKKSCPSNASITDMGDNTYLYQNGQQRFLFGVNKNKEFFGELNLAKESYLRHGKTPINKALNVTKDKRFCMLLNLTKLDNNVSATITQILRPLFGEIQYVCYSLK